jgi:hypothetical protein
VGVSDFLLQGRTICDGLTVKRITSAGGVSSPCSKGVGVSTYCQQLANLVSFNAAACFQRSVGL